MEVTRQLQAELRAIGQWVLGVVSAEPGWDRMILELKPQGGRMWLRISEDRDGQIHPGTVGPLNASNPVLRRIERLQSLSYRPGRGTWFATRVIVTATGWPDPEHRFTARHGYDDRPEVFGDEGPYTLADALEHLARFPRVQERVPGWLAHLAAQEDRVIEVLPPEADGVGGNPESINPLLREAVLAFAAAPSDETLIDALRQCAQGLVLLDATGSDIVPGPGGEPIGPQSTVRLQSLREHDGSTSLAAFTSAQDAREAFRRHGQEGEPVLIEQPGTVLLDLVARDAQYDFLVLDPGGATCRIPRRQIEWLMGSPRNDVVKGGLVSRSVPQMLSGMVGRESQLLLATPPADQQTGAMPQPVLVAPQGGGVADTLYVFTSVAEVAALDPSLEARAALGRDVLQFAVDSGARRICLNARSPISLFEIEDIVEVLASLEQADRESASRGGRRSGRRAATTGEGEDPGGIPPGQPFSPRQT